MPKLIGLDGCKGGWLAMIGTDDLADIECKIVFELHPFLDALDPDHVQVVIDIPIGLPSAAMSRACDIEARRFLGKPRSNSVFPAPCRETLVAETYLEACELNAGHSGKKISRQLFELLDKIDEVDTLMTPERQDWLREAHPELIFAVLSGTGRGLVHSKRTIEGEQERLAVLSQYGLDLNVDALRNSLSRKRVERNDIVDAAACLLSARRIAAGQAVVIPDDPVIDERGLRMEMVA